MKTTMKNKPLSKVKKYEAGGAAGEMECTEYMDRGKKKKRCKQKFGKRGIPNWVKKAGAGAAGAAAAIGAYAKNVFGIQDKAKEFFSQQKGGSTRSYKKGGVSKSYKMGGIKKTTARTRK